MMGEALPKERHCGPRFVVAILLALVPTAGMAKLMFRTDDVYVRGADLIVIGNTASTSSRDGVVVAVIEPSVVLLGAPPAARISVYSRDQEDMPVFDPGERSLLFLTASGGSQDIYSCVGGGAGKRIGVPDHPDSWSTLVERITLLAKVRQQAGNVRIATLVGLLDSSDTQLAAAASNYLNYLVHGEEDEEWSIRPPKGSSEWSWDDYFERNVVAHRKEWKRWWLAKRDVKR